MPDGRAHDRRHDAPPDRPLLIAFYGDDFTGSTDAMEALAFSGVRTVLFLEPPTRQALDDRFPDIRGLGVAGVSRTMSPEQMERRLRPIFEQLKALSPSIVHYKICSTFDSSPAIGSIGKAIDIAAEVFAGQGAVPLIVGAPSLRRYTLFGQHYAGVGEQVYRLDRHPTMSRHPVTPMDEADLSLHLGKQTGRSIALMDILDLTGDGAAVRERLRARTASSPDVLLYDVLDDQRLTMAGQLIWEEALERQAGGRLAPEPAAVDGPGPAPDRGSDPVYAVVGSSGVEYALTAHWQQAGMVARPAAASPSRGKMAPIFVVSGSCSPVTEAQIRFALASDRGFAGMPVPVDRLIDPQEAGQARRQLHEQAAALIREGRSPLLYTAMGSEDASIPAIKRKLADSGLQATDTGQLIGEQLGLLARELIADTGVKRFVAAGGDTSGFVTRALGIYALECLMPIAPGGPLCRGYSDDPGVDGIELALKGGQVGKADYFVRVLEGK